MGYKPYNVYRLERKLFPKKAKALVKEFVIKYQKELKEMWDTEIYSKLPPLQ